MWGGRPGCNGVGGFALYPGKRKVGYTAYFFVLYWTRGCASFHGFGYTFWQLIFLGGRFLAGKGTLGAETLGA